ncbi:hypothetical protein [Rhizorhabdus sp.]|uniref:hypothetical protein n=1 Tax=Rhizorhabdus sp. TaxID=1968843 RepID=UPI0035B1A43D
MSSARWPSGTLRRALLSAHGLYPKATAPELARIVGCRPESARQVLRDNGVRVPSAHLQRLTWTDDMKRTLIDGSLSGRSVQSLAEQIGVDRGTLALGAIEVIRDLIHAKGEAV